MELPLAAREPAVRLTSVNSMLDWLSTLFSSTAEPFEQSCHVWVQFRTAVGPDTPIRSSDERAYSLPYTRMLDELLA